MPISRDRPLKQNIRVWYNYLQTAIKHKYKINKEYYRTWHLTQVRTLKFDAWWKTHKHLFAHKEYVNLRIDNSLSYADAIKKVKKELVGKVDKKSSFQITSDRFRYLQVDDYLKCWKRRNEKNETYVKIGVDLLKEYQKKEELYSKSTKLIRRKFTNKKIEEWRSQNKKEVMLQVVRRKVINAQKIIENTAKGQFTGEY
jgi:hypothetical protein